MFIKDVFQQPGKKTVDFRRGVFLMLLMSLVLILPARPLGADIGTQYGLSPRGIAMANAMGAVADDWSAGLYNVAGLAQQGEGELAFGYFHVHPSVKTGGGPGLGSDGYKRDMNNVTVGFKVNLIRLIPEKWERNLCVGFALILLESAKKAATFDTRLYDEKQFPVFDRDPDIFLMSGGLGLEVVENFYVGIGLKISVMLDCKDVTVGVNGIGLDEGNIVLGLDLMNVEANIDFEMLPMAGFVWRPWDPLRIAGVWRRGGTIGQVGMKLGGYVEGFRLPIAAELYWLDFYQPQEISFSIAYEPLAKVLIALEVTHQKWSSYNLAFDKKPPGDVMHDIFVPRLGVEYSLTDLLKLRMGYYYQKSPVQAYQTDTCYLDTDKHVFSCGSGIALDIKALERIFAYPLQLDFHFQYHYLPRRSLMTVHGPVDLWGYAINGGGNLKISF